MLAQISKFAYDYDDLGHKTQATETHRIGGVDKSIVTTWEYDERGRLTKEVLTHHNTSQSKTQSWQYDAVGNRTKQVCGTQTTTYVYNNNDQLTDEQLIDTASSANNRLTKRTYSASRMTLEFRYRGSSVATVNQELRKDFSYHHDQRLYATTIRHYNTSGVFQLREYVRSMYDETGMAMWTDHYENPIDDSNYTVKFRNLFIHDRHNPTGYTQVMRETYNNTISGNVFVRSNAHTFGHERISEKTTIALQPNAPQTYFFVHDGRSSTRCLTDISGTVTERYDYDAFGNAVGFAPSQSLTKYLYCGELFDHILGWTYLRARYYDPKVGRFNRVDPFFGNLSDPQSLHKYTYCHGDPVNFIDPMGMFTVNSTLSASGIQSTIMSGLSYLNTAMRIYKTASLWYGRIHDVISLYTYAQLAVGFLKAFMVSSPQGAAMIMVNEIMKSTGANVDPYCILNSFELMMRELNKDWSEISQAIAKDAPKIAAEVAAEYAPRIAKYTALHNRGSLKLILQLPTGPGNTAPGSPNQGRSGEMLIPIGQSYLGVSVFGGRLFGLTFSTDKANKNRDQLFRIDYWDTRSYLPKSSPLYNAQVNRPTKTPLHIHYHIGTDAKGNKHDPNRTIWPK